VNFIGGQRGPGRNATTTTTRETTMTNLDPQTTADFWDAYVTAADAGADLVSVSRTPAGGTK